MTNTKRVIIIVLSAVESFLGVLAVPVYILVSCNVIDYITGLMAAKYRNEPVSSYKGVRGIFKKVSMWLLVIVGAFIDRLINYAVSVIGFDFKVPFVVATVVAVWLSVNEIISILENIVDMEVALPPFLLPLIKKVKGVIESETKIGKEE